MQIRIPDLIKAYNATLIYGDHPGAHFMYERTIDEGSAKAGDCLQCGQCEGVCPQHLGIIEILEKISNVFDK